MKELFLNKLKSELKKLNFEITKDEIEKILHYAYWESDEPKAEELSKEIFYLGRCHCQKLKWLLENERDTGWKFAYNRSLEEKHLECIKCEKECDRGIPKKDNDFLDEKIGTYIFQHEGKQGTYFLCKECKDKFLCVRCWNIAERTEELQPNLWGKICSFCDDELQKEEHRRNHYKKVLKAQENCHFCEQELEEAENILAFQKGAEVITK